MCDLSIDIPFLEWLLLFKSHVTSMSSYSSHIVLYNVEGVPPSTNSFRKTEAILHYTNQLFSGIMTLITYYFHLFIFIIPFSPIEGDRVIGEGGDFL